LDSPEQDQASTVTAKMYTQQTGAYNNTSNSNTDTANFIKWHLKKQLWTF